MALIAKPTADAAGTVSETGVPSPTPEPATVSATATAAVSATATAAIPTPETVVQPVQRSLQRLAAPVISDTVPRIRNTLGGIASTPRRRMTLMVIQGLASVFALFVFGYLILRRRQ